MGNGSGFDIGNVRQMSVAPAAAADDHDVSSIGLNVSALIQQCRSVADWGASNREAVLACLELASTWLDQEEGTARKISQAHEGMRRVVRSNVDTSWLFKEDGEPRSEAMSPEVFEVLIELRVLADRLERAGMFDGA